MSEIGWSRRWIPFLLVALLVCLAACDKEAARRRAAEKLGYNISDAFVASGIAEKEPVGIAEHFFADVGTLYCFSEIVGAEKSVTVRHRWFHGEQQVADVELQVKSAKWRTWSSKSIAPDQSGSWRVEILSSDGTVLREVPFRVGE